MAPFPTIHDTLTRTPFKKESPFRIWLTRVSRWRLSSFVLTVAAFVLSATATGVTWRVWHFDSDAKIGSGTLVIGIWKVCFFQQKKVVRQIHDKPRCWSFTEQHTSLPKAMLIAQDLMLFVNLLDISTIGLMCFALWNVPKSKNPSAFLLTFFSIAAAMSSISAILLLVPVVWNTHAILLAQEIKFPPEFNLPHFPRDQDIGIAIFLAYGAIFLKFLSTLLIVSENTMLKLKVKPTKSVGSTPPDSQTICPRCGSSIDLTDLAEITDWYSDTQFSLRLRLSSKDDQGLQQGEHAEKERLESVLE